MTRARVRLGISSCLLGEAVRYDGGHKRNDYIVATLGRYFDFVPFCPEVAIGLGVPRPPIQLVRTAQGVRVRGVADATLDVTEKLSAYADGVALQLGGVSGYILKKDSPSCGMRGVRVYGAKRRSSSSGTGMYARTLMERLPDLPFEEEDRLLDPALCENFVERVIVYHRWQRLMARPLTPNALVEFHTRHKFVVLAHDEKAYRALGRLVAGAGRGNISANGLRYLRLLMQALEQPATRARHANVLQHVFGFLRHALHPGEKQELLGIIHSYRLGQVPLAVPITRLRHCLRRYPEPYLAKQYYLTPRPDGLRPGAGS